MMCMFARLFVLAISVKFDEYILYCIIYKKAERGIAMKEDLMEMEEFDMDLSNQKDFHWNWGAFMFSIFFGFATKAWLCFLTLVPLVNIVWPFVCGAKGEKWAWETGEYDFNAFQVMVKSWNRAGLFAFILAVVVIVINIVAAASFTALIASFFNNMSTVNY